MQLVAYGAQDMYLTGNPQITFFKVIYRRHTNFSMESIEQTFNGSADWGKKVTCTVSRNGDLIHRVYLRVELPEVTVPARTSSSAYTGFRWLNMLGHILVKSVEIEIGGQRIDKHYGEWLHIWNELTQTAGHQLGYANMIGNIPQLTTPLLNDTTSAVTVPGQILYIPLEFWFCRNPGLALPLIALQYHEVKINLELRDAKDCYWAGTTTDTGANWTTNLSAPGLVVPALDSCSLFVDYIYLDTDERRRFAQTAHEYLIEQLQFTGDESTSNTNNKVKLSYNHPTKALYWVVSTDENVTDQVGSVAAAQHAFGKQWFNFTDKLDFSYNPSGVFTGSNATLVSPGDREAGSMPGVAAGGANNVFLPVSFEDGKNPVAFAKLQLNGHDRFSERDGRYFNLVQPYQHHENVPKNGINMYSFGLKPEEHQPSGTCNMSRIDNATLQLTLTSATVTGNKTAKIKIFATSYNVLRVMSGMGGLAYSN
jgi:Major capsid protein N-terminus/Large eukaryotic DNA virus major capsid protein